MIFIYFLLNVNYCQSVLFAGFMMEMASWDGGISRTVQFLVPKVREFHLAKAKHNLPF